MNHAETKNSINMTGGVGWLRHHIGAIAEKIWSILTGAPVDTKTIGRGDGGTDFPDGTQVKGAYQRNRPNLLIPVSQYRREDVPDPKRYVLIWVKPNKLDCEVLGQISVEEFDQLKRLVRKGERNMVVDTWWVDTWRLHKIDFREERRKERLRQLMAREEVQLNLF